MKHLFLILFFIPILIVAQTKELTYNEFLGYVKKYHPLVKQANLNISESQAQLMQARGAFDPKIEVDFDKKDFKDKNYYSIFNSSFKIPTWYGIELKAAFNNSEGIFVNPEITTPNQGLTSLGIRIPVGQGLFINQRMADLRKAKLALTLNTAERDLQALEIIYEASNSYFNWKRAYHEVQLYESYFKNASVRFKGIEKLIEQGDKPAIDSIEAGIAVRNRQLNLEDAQLKLRKAKLEVSNYIWTKDNIPLEIDDTLYPEIQLEKTIRNTLSNIQLKQLIIDHHPKLKALNAKIDMLLIEQRLKANTLLPKLDVSYNYLSEPDYLMKYRFQDYKLGINFSMPLFLRKERGSLKLAKLKIQDVQFSLEFEKQQLKNKVEALYQEQTSLEKQLQINKKLVSDFEKMLSAEEHLFAMGESSLFLINSRENSLVSSKLSNIALENRFYNLLISIYKSLGKYDL
ncbi:TolC family protein [Flavobacterium oreochromis]|uniref:Transporter n=2 Tax=Flavobacterium TaxID=237 RepID=A0A246GCL2_9FLAO|nr:TolC family protein [Flavobacterium oreochromis]OWP78228.1 transporter [Flavobacterium oreochromis]OWP78869.1 transporter [Flavobacterium oreochromis]POR25667.1 transporter [Flavobacterium columnare]QYS87577.1 TolC family protein [Flavobacterium oreochromis]